MIEIVWKIDGNVVSYFVLLTIICDEHIIVTFYLTQTICFYLRDQPNRKDVLLNI